MRRNSWPFPCVFSGGSSRAYLDADAGPEDGEFPKEMLTALGCEQTLGSVPISVMFCNSGDFSLELRLHDLPVHASTRLDLYSCNAR